MRNCFICKKRQADERCTIAVVNPKTNEIEGNEHLCNRCMKGLAKEHGIRLPKEQN